MATFTERWESGSLRVSDLDAEKYPLVVRNKCRWISHVYVPPEDRRKGIATFLMHKVIGQAKEKGITLLLAAAEFDEGGMSDEQLRGWYERLGFRVLQRDPEILARYPWA